MKLNHYQLKALQPWLDDGWKIEKKSQGEFAGDRSVRLVRKYFIPHSYHCLYTRPSFVWEEIIVDLNPRVRVKGVTQVFYLKRWPHCAYPQEEPFEGWQFQPFFFRSYDGKWQEHEQIELEFLM